MNEQNKNRKKRSSKKRWSTKKKIILSTVVVFALIIGMLASGYLYIRSRIYSGLNPSEITSDIDYQEVDGITNVLLLNVTVGSEFKLFFNLIV